MTQYLYMGCFPNGRADISEDWQDIIKLSLSSLGKHTSVEACIATVGLTQDQKAQIEDAYGHPCRFVEPPNYNSHKWLLYLVRCLLDLNFLEGDEIIAIDADTISLADPFTAFEKPFDIGYTLRSGGGLVNTGLMAFRWSTRVEAFIYRWVSELLDPHDTGYRLWRIQKGSLGKLEVPVDQDYIACLIGVRHFLGVTLANIGSQYNWFPVHDTLDKLEEAWKEIQNRPPDTKMVHFKGHLKPLMIRVANEI